MKYILGLFFALFLGVFGAFRAPFSAAAATPSLSASDLLAAVDSLQTIDAARQNAQHGIGLQFAQVSEEVRNLISQPIDTADERAALVAELGAISAKLEDLSSEAQTLDEVQAAENSLFAELQAQEQAL